ncbi:hypothetical protein QOZ80_7BG0584290 [Eleusine coracana subsp. coracana]|nr:hypothetical protein QOZ80_7BG0584290 [Eleusine coracana subsp. coracana]
MAKSGGEVAADAGVDWISALPDDILVFILLRLDTIAEAARTGVLSHRWRRVWALLPVLLFPDGRHIRFLRLALPSSGAFARLAELGLKRVRFQGPLKLGDVVSSPRSPCLRILSVCDSFGVDSLTVHSKSLLRMELSSLNGLQELTIDAPALKELQLLYCFDQIQPVVDIAAPQLVSLYWNDACHRISVQLGNLGQLQLLSTNYILVYGPQCTRRHNHEIQWLLQRFQAIHSLDIMLFYGSVDIDKLQYLMEDMTHLPHVTFLRVDVLNEGHAFGAGLFHVLRLGTRIRNLSLRLQLQETLKEQSPCQPGCSCEQPTNWMTEELLLNCLQEVEISFLRGWEHEVIFVKQLFKWASVLEKMTIIFHQSIGCSKAMELCQTISSFTRPETCVEFYMYDDAGRRPLRLLAPEIQGTGMRL